MDKETNKAAKQHAQSLYMLTDISGARKYTLEHIAKDILRVYGEKVAPSTVSRWSIPWENQMNQARVLAAEASELSLLQHEEDITPKKNVMDRLEKLQTCIQTQLHLGIIANSKRFKKYLDKEDELLKFISTPENDLSDEEKDRMDRIRRLLPLQQILAGIKQSNEMYHGYVNQLFKLDGLKKQNEMIEAEATTLDDTWEFEPVDILTFMLDKNYLNISKHLFPVVENDLKEIFYGSPRTMTRMYREVVMKGAVGSGKCNIGATLCINSATGKTQSIDELLVNNEKCFWSYGLNTTTWKIERVKVTDIVHNGKRRVHKLTLESGRNITSTDNHQFYGKTGWRELKNFGKKDLVAISRTVLDKIIDSDILWDKVKSIEELPGEQDVYDLVVDSPSHNFVANGIITHNSEAAAIISTYLVYLCLCLRNPSDYFGFFQGSKIAIINVSVNTKQAKNVVFGKIKAKIDGCKWFREHYMYDNRSKLELRFDPCDSTHITENRIYKNVYIIPGNSSAYSAVGYDILCAIIDEATLYPKIDDKDQAQTIYAVLRERVISRFNDKGLIVMLGNPMHTEDFLEKRIKSAMHEKGTYCVPERSVWDAKFPNWEGEVFYFDRYKLVEVDVEKNKERKYDPDVIKIPKIYYDNFIANPEQSARGLGGWSLESISRFLKNSENIDSMYSKRVNPVKEIDEIECTVEFNEGFKPASNGWHTIHLDLGTVSDAVGICLGHIQVYKDGKPSFMVDALIRIKGTKTNPAIFSRIRDIIYQIQNLGFHIKCVTMDGYQSTDTIQILRAKGFKAELLSVDKTVLPYGNLKNVINEKRIDCPYNPILDKELRNLEDIGGKKIDHPFRGSKDLADSLCGMVNGCMEYIPMAAVTTSIANVAIKKTEKKAEITPESYFANQFEKMGS